LGGYKTSWRRENKKPKAYPKEKQLFDWLSMIEVFFVMIKYPVKVDKGCSSKKDNNIA